MAAHYKYCDDHAISIPDAIALIKENTSGSYQWYVVKSKAGCFFNLGGRNNRHKPVCDKPTDSLEIKADIPYYEDGNVVKYSLNEMAHNEYTVDFDQRWDKGRVEWACHRADLPIFKRKLAGFIKWIENRDFINNPVKFEKVVVGYEPIYGTKIIM